MNNHSTNEQNVQDEDKLTPDELADFESCRDPDSDLASLSKIPSDDIEQMMIVQAMIYDREFCKELKQFCKPSHFTHEYHKHVVKTCFEYLDKYPNQWLTDVYLINAKEKALQESGANADKHKLWTDELIALCKNDRGCTEAAREHVKEFQRKSAFTEIFKEGLSGYDLKKAASQLTEAYQKIENFDQKKKRGLTFNEFMAIVPPPWLIDGLIPSEASICVFGPSGSGKTFHALDMALSVACGVEFLGRHKTIKKKVAYVISEGKGSFNKRLLAWSIQHAIQPAESDIVFLPHAYDLTEGLAGAQQILDDAKETLGCLPEVVVIDTIARNFGGGDEDKTKDMNKFVNSIGYLQVETNGTVICVHHTGKDATKKERGNSALRGAIDTSLEVTQSKELETVTIRCIKQKDAGNFADYFLGTKIIEDANSLVFVPMTAQEHETAVAVADDLKSKVLSVMPTVSDPSILNCKTVKHFAECTKGSEGAIRKVLGSLVDDGLVSRFIFEGSKANFYCSLTP